MPQGGIDSKEKSELAALREMEEEVGIKKNKVKALNEFLEKINILDETGLNNLYKK